VVEAAFFAAAKEVLGSGGIKRWARSLAKQLEMT
jgi:hypothetical protein